MKRIRATVAALPLLALLAACGGGDEPGATNVSSGPSPTDTRSDSADSDPPADNLGQRALALGRPHTGPEYTTTLLGMKALKTERSPEPAPGMRFVGIHVRSCSTPEAIPIHDYNAAWALVLADGTEYAGRGQWTTDWPSPKFDENANQPAGSCKQGWMALEVPPNLAVERIRWSPGGQPTAEWIVGKTI